MFNIPATVNVEADFNWERTHFGFLMKDCFDGGFNVCDCVNIFSVDSQECTVHYQLITQVCLIQAYRYRSDTTW